METTSSGWVYDQLGAAYDLLDEVVTAIDNQLGWEHPLTVRAKVLRDAIETLDADLEEV